MRTGRLLSEVIVEARLKKGLSMRKLSSLTGISAMQLSRLENDTAFSSTGDSLRKIADVLNLDEDKLRMIAKNSENFVKDQKEYKSESLAVARKIAKSNIDKEKLKRILEILGE